MQTEKKSPDLHSFLTLCSPLFLTQTDGHQVLSKCMNHKNSVHQYIFKKISKRSFKFQNRDLSYRQSSANTTPSPRNAWDEFTEHISSIKEDYSHFPPKAYNFQSSGLYKQVKLYLLSVLEIQSDNTIDTHTWVI